MEQKDPRYRARAVQKRRDPAETPTLARETRHRRSRPRGRGHRFGSWPRRRTLRSSESHLDLFGAALLVVAQQKDGPNRNLADVGGQIVTADDNPILPPHCQPAGSLAALIVGVADREPALARNRRVKMKRVARMFLKRQIITVRDQRPGLSLHGDQHALGVERSGHLAISSQPGRPVGTRQRADQPAQVLREGELRETHFVVNREPSRRDGRLN